MPIRPRSGRRLGGAPEKIVLQFLGARMFEAEHLAALRIDAGHDVPDGAVLAGGVHRLKNQQHRIAVGRVVKALQRAQLLNLFFEEFVILLLRLVNGLHQRRPLFELDLFACLDPKILELIFIFIPSLVDSWRMLH